MVLEELHQGHPGITQMKGLARSFVWWPGMDKELEQMVKCQLSTISEDTSSSTPTPMGIAQATMVKNTCKLCWSLPG